LWSDSTNYKITSIYVTINKWAESYDNLVFNTIEQHIIIIIVITNRIYLYTHTHVYSDVLIGYFFFFGLRYSNKTFLGNVSFYKTDTNGRRVTGRVFAINNNTDVPPTTKPNAACDYHILSRNALIRRSRVLHVSHAVVIYYSDSPLLYELIFVAHKKKTRILRASLLIVLISPCDVKTARKSRAFFSPQSRIALYRFRTIRTTTFVKTNRTDIFSLRVGHFDRFAIFAIRARQ